MVTFIANRIIREADKSVEKGRRMYKAYFITTSIYAKWRADVDAILTQEGYEDVIIAD